MHKTRDKKVKEESMMSHCDPFAMWNQQQNKVTLAAKQRPRETKRWQPWKMNFTSRTENVRKVKRIHVDYGLREIGK